MSTPKFVHTISEDGLSLKTIGSFGNLDLITTVSWDTLEKAKQNYQLSMTNNEKFQKLEADSADPDAIGSKSWAKIIHPFGVNIQLGFTRGNDYDSKSICVAGREIKVDIVDKRTVWSTLKFTVDKKKVNLFGFGGRTFALYFRVIGNRRPSR